MRANTYNIMCNFKVRRRKFRFNNISFFFGYLPFQLCDFNVALFTCNVRLPATGVGYDFFFAEHKSGFSTFDIHSNNFLLLLTFVFPQPFFSVVIPWPLLSYDFYGRHFWVFLLLSHSLTCLFWSTRFSTRFHNLNWNLRPSRVSESCHE